MKFTVHEKSRVLVCFAAKADRTLLKSMIVFKGEVRECNVLHQDFQTQAVIASYPNGWINTELILQWVKKVIEAFSFKQRLLPWDLYECHTEGTV